MSKPYVSIVIPVYNEEESLPELYQWVIRVMQEHAYSFEIVFVNDGSSDTSWEVIEDLQSKDNRIRGINFVRNYGKSAALQVGFDHSAGERVVTMDADLQDNPEEVPAMLDLIEKHNYDLVSGWKKKRYDPLSKTIPSKIFNRVTGIISGIKLHDFNCGLKVYKSKVVKSIHVYGEMHRYIPVIAKWNGFKAIGEKPVQHQPRKYGQTKYGWKRFVTGFLDLLSITFVTRFSRSPMHFFGTFGALSFLLGLGITIYLIGEKIYKLNQELPVRDIVDQPLFFLALVVLLVGVQLFLAGFLAEMMVTNSMRKYKYLIDKEI